MMKELKKLNKNYKDILKQFQGDFEKLKSNLKVQ